MTSIPLSVSEAGLIKKTDYKRKREEYVTVTPAVAAAWLEKNIETNRRINRPNVYSMSVAMKNGVWRDIDDPIRFDWHGNMFDGQHRCLACIEAGVPFKTKVIYGYPPEARKWVDNGKQRSAADNMQIDGVKNAINVASTVRLLILEANSLSIAGGGRSTPSRDQIEGFLAIHAKLPQYCFYPNSLPRGVPMNMLSAINYIEARILGNADSAAEIVNVIRSGVPSYDGDPLHKWRERLLIGVGFEKQNEKWTALKWAYNRWRLKVPVAVVRVLPGKKVWIDDLKKEDLTKGSPLFDPIKIPD